MVWYPLKEIAKRTDAQIIVTPVFLGGMHKLTGNAPPMIRDAEVKGKNAYAMLEMNRFITKHELGKWKLNPKFPFNSVTLQRLLLAADGHKRTKIIETLLPAIWEESLDITDLGALTETLNAGGHDAAALFEKTQDPAIKQMLIDNTENAVDRGAFGIPTFFVNGEIYFGKERLGQVEEQLMI